MTTTDYKTLLDDPDIEAVVVTAPTPSHYELAKAALLTGRHVFVEKPIALAVEQAEELVALAAERRRVLMVGHLLMYHPAVTRLKHLVTGGELGDIYYLYSSRLNLGQVRRNENAMWSLAPHDISVALFLLEEQPVMVAAQGLTYLQPGIPDTVFVTLRFASGKAAHIHVSWLDPHKVRRITVVGSQKMAVFDDVDSTEKLRIYDRGVQRPAYDSYGDSLSLRFGDISIPRVDIASRCVSNASISSTASKMDRRRSAMELTDCRCYRCLRPVSGRSSTTENRLRCDTVASGRCRWQVSTQEQTAQERTMNERFIDPSAEIGEGCTLGYGVVIEELGAAGAGMQRGAPRGDPRRHAGGCELSHRGPCRARPPAAAGSNEHRQSTSSLATADCRCWHQHWYRRCGLHGQYYR